MNVTAPGAGTKAQSGSARGATIIVRKVKKGGHPPHHGGAWKVAYADFVTAMMAFFLLMWLLNATTQDQRSAISNYFAPEAPAQSKSGSGGMLGGTVISQDGGATASRGGGGVVVPLPRAPRAEKPDYNNSNEPAGREAGAENEVGDGSLAAARKAAARKAAWAAVALARAIKRDRAHDEKRFARIEKALRAALDEEPNLRKLADNLMFDRTREGLRIQLVDQDKIAMFELGSAKMPPHTRELLKRLAVIIRRMPNKISITGHTDATPYTNPDGYGNWELSTDRANASRRGLMDAGIPTDRFALVAGKADRELLLPGDPTNARNRRISIVILGQRRKVAGE